MPQVCVVHRLFSSINVQNYEIEVAELPVQENRFAVSPWTLFPPETLDEVRIRLSALAQLLLQAAGRVNSVQEAATGKAWLLFESSLRPFKVKYHKAGPIFGVAVWKDFAVRYGTAASFLGPPGPSFGSKLSFR